MQLAVDSIRNAQGEALDFAFTPAQGDAHPGQIVVIGHGVTANKDREWSTTLADTLAAAGWASLRFSFSGNGDSEGDFRESCPSKEVEDLRAVVDALAGWRISYAGHSMGAAVGVLAVSQGMRFDHLISLGGMVHTGDFADRKFGDQKPGESLMWEKPECPLSQAFMDDMHAVGTVEQHATLIAMPWLLVHGDQDTVVPPSESETMLAGNPAAKLVILPGADHVFSGASAEAMARAVADWLKA